jgi:hypothetical protein
VSNSSSSSSIVSGSLHCKAGTGICCCCCM